MGIGTQFAQAAVAVQLLNGKIKPKFGIVPLILGTIFWGAILIGAFIALIYGIINMNIEFIIMPLIGICSIIYLLLISAYTQRSSNYYIEFQSEDSLEGFKLSYKGKLVDIKYKIDKEGKIAFADNKNKLNCLSYADGTKMSNFVKYRIMNYFGRWLHQNNLLSSEVTITYEEL